MSKFRIRLSDPFKRNLKQLAKKHISIIKDVENLFTDLANNPTLGTPLGKDCYKIRLAITSKGKGKSGGSRVITYVHISNEEVFLLTIYDKSEKADITVKELNTILKSLGLD